jgi:hypothetical protein
MLIPKPFIKLPLFFDHEKLAEEISQFDEQHWRPHPQDFEGNSSLIFVSTGGGENDDLSGSQKPSIRLQKTPYIRQVMGSFNTVIGRSRLMRLAPGAHVSQHTDSHYFWRHHLRIHIPIITDPAVAFFCGSEEVHMAAGESWTFNNWQNHSVENHSDKERIHLIIDTVGSASLWKMIDGRDQDRRFVGCDDQDNSKLQFEEYSGLPVLPSSELRADLERLIDDIDEKVASHATTKQQIKTRTDDFLRDWHSQWVAFGPSVDGFAGFKSLLESFRSYIGKIPAQLVLVSNHESFSEAATFTLDAALAPEKYVPENSGNHTRSSAASNRPRFDRPVFIVAAPRSGSTLLFETLAVNRELWSLGDESHKHFENIASLRPSGKNPSNCLTADMATQDVRETLLDSFVADLVNADGKPLSDLSVLSRPNEIRFLEKTPKNALRIPFLLKIFPDARFIFLFRDARQNMSSLLETWGSRNWVTYPQLPNWPADKPWSHLLIPGWQDVRNGSLAEIVARQWLVTNQIILDELQQLPSERWCTIEYDSLLANTASELQRLCLFSQVIFGPRMHQIASRPLKLSKYTMSAPQKDKWKKNAAELEPVLESTEALMAKLRELDSENKRV